jgi:hypothetical protein
VDFRASILASVVENDELCHFTRSGFGDEVTNGVPELEGEGAVVERGILRDVPLLGEGGLAIGKTEHGRRDRENANKLHGINILLETFSLFYLFGCFVELMKIDFVRDEKRYRDICGRVAYILFVSQKRGSLLWRRKSVLVPPKNI